MVHISDTEYQRSRVKNCKMRSGNSKKVNHQTATGFEQKTSKLATMRRKEMVRQIFNEIIKQNEFTLEAWKKVKLKVLHKKGDVENVGDYCPISSLPALYKLFSTILYRARFDAPLCCNLSRQAQPRRYHTSRRDSLKRKDGLCLRGCKFVETRCETKKSNLNC